MYVRHTVICLFFLSLQEGNSGLVDAKMSVFSGNEGGEITVKCSFSSYDRRKIFCRETCNQDDILVNTTSATAQRGRYNIRYKRGRKVHVSISQLTKSDSGLYSCGLGTTYVSFEIIVVDALLDGESSEEPRIYATTGGNFTAECSFTSLLTVSTKYFCREPCTDEDILVSTNGFKDHRGRYGITYSEETPKGFLYVSTTQLTKSDSGRYRCALQIPLFPDPFRTFEVIVTDAPNTTLPPSPQGSTPSTTNAACLYVGLTLAIMVVLLSLAVLMYCRRRASDPKGPAVDSEYASVTESNRAYEDIREYRHSISPPVGISSVYTTAKHTKADAAKSNDSHSFVTTAGSRKTAEDTSSKLTYAEVKFSDWAAGSSGSGLSADTNDVVYAVPRVAVHRTEDAEPVYSNVT